MQTYLPLQICSIFCVLLWKTMYYWFKMNFLSILLISNRIHVRPIRSSGSIIPYTRITAIRSKGDNSHSYTICVFAFFWVLYIHLFPQTLISLQASVILMVSMSSAKLMSGIYYYHYYFGSAKFQWTEREKSIWAMIVHVQAWKI